MKKKRIPRKKRRIESSPLVPNRGMEIAYARAIREMTRNVIRQTAKEIFANGKPTAQIIPALNAVKDATFAEMSEGAYTVAKMMVDAQSELSLRAVRSVAMNFAQQIAEPVAGNVMQSGIGLSFSMPGKVIPSRLIDVMKASIEENVSLIKSIPQQYHTDIEGAVMRSIQNGGSLKQLAEDVRKCGTVAMRRASNIALDQSRKTFTALNVARFKEIGIRKFKWVHTAGSVHPRKFHLRNFPDGLNGGIFDIDHPPVIEPNSGIRGYPAQLPYCRCHMSAVIELDE